MNMGPGQTLIATGMAPVGRENHFLSVSEMQKFLLEEDTIPVLNAIPGLGYHLHTQCYERCMKHHTKIGVHWSGVVGENGLAHCTFMGHAGGVESVFVPPEILVEQKPVIANKIPSADQFRELNRLACA